MNRFIKGFLFFIIPAAILTLTPLPLFPAHANPLDPYIEGAKKEGAISLGITLREKSHGKPSGEKYLAAFQKRYPFLKVSFTRVGGSQDRERTLTEMMSGIVKYDVVTVSETLIPTVAEAKLERIVEWQKLGVPKYFVHPKNYGLSMRTQVYGIAYNRNVIPDAAAKTFTWETCTDPKWKGRTAMDDRPRHLNRLFLDDAWGRDKALDYAKRWAANKPSFEAVRSTAAEKLAMGSYVMICGLPRRQVLDIQVNEGSKAVGIVYPEPVPVSTGDFIYVPAKANHPNAAILFMVWTGTTEAQQILDDIDFTGHPAIEGNDSHKELRGKKVLYGSFEDSKKADDNLAEILQAMGMPVVR